MSRTPAPCSRAAPWPGHEDIFCRSRALTAHPWPPGNPSFPPQPPAVLWGRPVTAAQHPGRPEGAEVPAAMGSPEKGLRDPGSRDLPSSPPAATGKGPGAAGPSLSPFPRPHAMPLPECPLLTSRGWSRGRRCEADGGAPVGPGPE